MGEDAPVLDDEHAGKHQAADEKDLDQHCRLLRQYRSIRGGSRSPVQGLDSDRPACTERRRRTPAGACLDGLEMAFETRPLAAVAAEAVLDPKEGLITYRPLPCDHLVRAAERLEFSRQLFAQSTVRL